jgi:hypothetical protein
MITPDFKFELWLSVESIRFICATICISVVALFALIVLLTNKDKGDKND